MIAAERKPVILVADPEPRTLSMIFERRSWRDSDIWARSLSMPMAKGCQLQNWRRRWRGRQSSSARWTYPRDDRTRCRISMRSLMSKVVYCPILTMRGASSAGSMCSIPARSTRLPSLRLRLGWRSISHAA
jgi:hypothetical protein